MKALRILMAGQIYSDGNGQGGFTLRLAENLAKQGHQVKMLMPSDRPTSYSETVNGVQIEKIAAIHMSIVHPAVYVTPWPLPRVKKIFQDFKKFVFKNLHTDFIIKTIRSADTCKAHVINQRSKSSFRVITKFF